MSKRDKTREVFLELVNLQLAPHVKTYEDVKDDPEWYMKYRTTREQEKVFQQNGTKLIREKLKITKKMAEQEMSWFILQWGLTTSEHASQVEQEVTKILKSKSD